MIIVNTGSSLEWYWDVEDRTEYKNEYIEGQIISRIGTSVRHMRIAQNLAMDLWKREDVPWHVLNGIRMKVEATGAYVWPDVMVYEEPGRFEDRRPHDDEMLLDPILLVEVYSPLTEALDRGTKWAHYRTIPSLREYVLISQDEVSIERYVRQGDEWLYSAISDPDGILHLASIGCEVPIREIYHDVELPSERVAMLIPPRDLLR
jgi:Uma2 family endonuclease